MRSLAILISSVVICAACSSAQATPQPQPIEQAPAELAFVSTTVTFQAPSTTTKPTAIASGTEAEPFVIFEQPDSTGVGLTPSGIVVPIIHETEDETFVQSACGVLKSVSSVQSIERPHVLLDPGHGGSEPGAVSESGLTEADVNLATALRTKEILEQRGAIVQLTRTSNTAMTLRTRGEIARRLQPGLFVSIHHNGGSSAVSNKPGLIAFTKVGSEESKQFGGLFYNEMSSLLETVKSENKAAHDQFLIDVAPHEESVRTYDASLASRNAALLANGQIDALPETTVEAIAKVPSERSAITTTTRPATSETTVAVPDTVTLPTPYEGEVVEELAFVGGGYAGVRSWLNDDNDDFLGVLRYSGDVPAALVEFLYLTNPTEAALLADQAYLDRQALALADSITKHFSTTGIPSGFVKDQQGAQSIGGSGGRSTCVEPALQ